jgi:hypothetical protein
MRRQYRTRNQILQERYGVPEYLLKPLPEERLPPIPERIRWCWERLKPGEKAAFLAEIGWLPAQKKAGEKASKPVRKKTTTGARR